VRGVGTTRLGILAAVLVVSLGREGQAQAQDLEAGGVVSLICGDCRCDGTSDDSKEIFVFDNPSSGERVRHGGHLLQSRLSDATSNQRPENQHGHGYHPVQRAEQQNFAVGSPK